jgi:hypothetical protein
MYLPQVAQDDSQSREGSLTRILGKEQNLLENAHVFQNLIGFVIYSIEIGKREVGK